MKKTCYIIRGEKKPPIRYKWDTVSKRMVQIGCGQNYESNEIIDYNGGGAANEFCDKYQDSGNGDALDGGNANSKSCRS